jgi:S-DNA-T family DNA segregation ATPase FtsK/SpoIIIE
LVLATGLVFAPVWATYAAGVLVLGGGVAVLRTGTGQRVSLRDVARLRWRRHITYAPAWEEATQGCGLVKRIGSELAYPKIVSVRGGRFFDEVRVTPPRGLSKSHFESAAPELAAALESPACRVRGVPGNHRDVCLHFQRHDALLQVVAPLPPPEVVDLDSVAVGRTEYGEAWRIRLLGTHILIGGETGSGKASAIWSIVRGVGPAVRDGLVELWGIDPKNGMELTHGREMFTRYLGEATDIEQQVALLCELVAVMEARSEKYATEKRRKHVVTLEDPLILCIIDELADITTHEKKKLRDEAIELIAKLLRRARSVGITVVMALQNPKKDQVPFRDLIPDGFGLRLKARFQIDATCGEGAYAAGANCLTIPGEPEPDQPIDGRGIAYKTTQGQRQPMRGRFSYITDEDLFWMVREFPAFDRVRAAADRAALDEEFDVDDDERQPSRP